MQIVLDFDFIEEGAENYMEWYGAFGLLVTYLHLGFSIVVITIYIAENYLLKV